MEGSTVIIVGTHSLLFALLLGGLAVFLLAAGGLHARLHVLARVAGSADGGAERDHAVLFFEHPRILHIFVEARGEIALSSRRITKALITTLPMEHTHFAVLLPVGVPRALEVAVVAADVVILLAPVFPLTGGFIGRVVRIPLPGGTGGFILGGFVAVGGLAGRSWVVGGWGGVEGGRTKVSVALDWSIVAHVWCFHSPPSHSYLLQ